MIIIGEKLNSAIPRVGEAIRERDAAYLLDLASRQAAAGAHYLDVNTSMGEEVPDMEWLVGIIQEAVNIPLCIDSTDPKAMDAGLKSLRGAGMINSITLEKKRLAGMLPIILGYSFPVIALTTDDNGIPKTAEDRLRLADQLVNTLARHNFDLDRLYVDPLVLPVAVDSGNPSAFFRCLREIKESYKVKTVSGLSNVSHSMPGRKIINRYFLALCLGSGMDAAIMDPLDAKLMTALFASDLLLGNDRFGRIYIKAHRTQRLVE